MTMINIDFTAPSRADGPFCETCHGRTRLAGIEPHPRLPRTDLRTYACDGCDSVVAVAAPHPRASINAIVLVDGEGRPKVA